MQLKKGTLLKNGKYKIIAVLGQGGFGITYLAEDTSLERKVAVKEFFPKDFCGRDSTSRVTLSTPNNADTVEKLRARFLKEARNLAKLSHPGIVRIFDVFEENDSAYYVMDYIEGDNLNEMVKMHGPLPIEKCVEYIESVGYTLSYIHQQNMTHFDVKPANIMIKHSDGQAVLIDFGLSKQYDSKGDATSTLMQAVSHGYSPIELYNGSLTTFSPQTDVYSLGATLYCLMSGTIPPNASLLVEEELTFPDSFPQEYKPLLLRAMSVSRKHRYEDVPSFLKELKAINQGQTAIIPPELVKPMDAPEDVEYEKKPDDSQGEFYYSMESAHKSKAWIVFLIIGILIAVGVGVFFFLIQNNTENVKLGKSEDNATEIPLPELPEAMKGIQTSPAHVMTLLLDDKNNVYFYEYNIDENGNGVPDLDNANIINSRIYKGAIALESFKPDVNGTPQGINAVIRQRNLAVMQEFDKLKDLYAQGKLTVDEFTQKAVEIAENRSLEPATILIKELPGVTFDNEDKLLDVLRQNLIRYYAFGDLSNEDIMMLQNFENANSGIQVISDVLKKKIYNEEDDIIIPEEEDEIIEPEIIEEEVTATQEAVKPKFTNEIIEQPKERTPVAEKEEIATIATVEQKPSFPGGEAAMYKWLGEQIVFPAQASEEGASGKVTVAFIIEKDGSVSNVQVVRGKHPALDAEAVRVVKKMPKWTPGRNNGVPVRVAYNLPITFKLQ